MAEATESGGVESGHEHSDDRTDFRSFVVVVHAEEGVLLLRAMKKKKGVHFQLPGGHIDASEIERYGFRLAQMTAAAREL